MCCCVLLLRVLLRVVVLLVCVVLLLVLLCVFLLRVCVVLRSGVNVNRFLLKVRRFREGKQHYCKAKGGTEGLQTKNNYGMWCYKVAGWGDRTNNPDVLCDAKGLLRIDFAKMNWRKSSEWDSSGKNNQFQPQKGAFAMPCETDLTLASAVGGDFMKALFSNLEPLALNVANNNDNNDIFDSAGCDKVITHPVIMIVRFEAWNLYHELGEWLNTFITLEVSECEC